MSNKVYQVVWPQKIKEDFEHLIGFVPVELRPIAYKAIVESANENARTRGASEVIEKDMVTAFLQNTPPFFRDNVCKSLKGIGVDLSKYSI